MRVRWVVPILALIPIAALAIGSHSLADWAGRRAALALDGALKGVSHPAPQAAPMVYVMPEGETPVDETSETRSPLPRRVGKVAAPSASRIPKKGVRVRADAVLRLANAGARPAGIPVPAQGQRPAGLALVGVSGLGIGLVDGDILTHAAGRPALAPGDVIGVVIGARAHGASEICGRFWRRGEPYNLIVEQPYVQPRHRVAARSGS